MKHHWTPKHQTNLTLQGFILLTMHPILGHINFWDLPLQSGSIEVKMKLMAKRQGTSPISKHSPVSKHLPASKQNSSSYQDNNINDVCFGCDGGCSDATCSRNAHPRSVQMWSAHVTYPSVQPKQNWKL
ncbi:hypothetical protein BgiMline_033370 [Biomphalaria glabrata]|nr:hypothetical protein BgiMline_024480 [Biomphalaria glabrata]